MKINVLKLIIIIIVLKIKFCYIIFYVNKLCNDAVNVFKSFLLDTFYKKIFLLIYKLLRDEFDFQIEYLKKETHNFTDKVSRQTQLRDLALRNFHNSEGSLKTIKNSVKFTEKMHKETSTKHLNLKQTNQTVEYLKQRNQLNKEIETLKMKFAEQVLNKNLFFCFCFILNLFFIL